MDGGTQTQLVLHPGTTSAPPACAREGPRDWSLLAPLGQDAGCRLAWAAGVFLALGLAGARHRGPARLLQLAKDLLLEHHLDRPRPWCARWPQEPLVYPKPSRGAGALGGSAALSFGPQVHSAGSSSGFSIEGKDADTSSPLGSPGTEDLALRLSYPLVGVTTAPTP